MPSRRRSSLTSVLCVRQVPVSFPLRTKSTEDSLELVQELRRMVGIRHARFDRPLSFAEVGLEDEYHDTRFEITRTALSDIKVGTYEYNSSQSNCIEA